MKHQLGLMVEPLFAVDEEMLFRTAQVVLDEEMDREASVGIVITDDETVRALNREYRGYDETTDVLSFGLSEMAKPAAEGEEQVDFPTAPDGWLHLGEIIISYETAARQASEAGKRVDEELRLLLVHGILHLVGYDHAEPEEEAIMRAREQALLLASL